MKWDPMKQKLLGLIFALMTVAHGATLVTDLPYSPDLIPDKQEAQAAHLAAEVLSRYHYKPVSRDGALAEKVFDKYLKSLDPEKLFFVQSDISQFSGDQGKRGDALIKDKLNVPFAIFNLYEHRVTERFNYAISLLDKGFDFQQDESYQLSRDKQAWPNSEADMHELWRKRVKNDWLRLKLAGNDDKHIVDILAKRYTSSVKRIGRLKAADAFQTYMNAYTMAIDPHTNYMGPRVAKDFDISMKLSLGGIGAVLTEIGEYPTIRELVPGGPANLSGQLNIGDRIVGIAQGGGIVMTDLQGWRLDDAVDLIRGAPDSVVQLQVLPANAGPDEKPKLVSLVRKTISLQDQAAKSAIYPVMDGKNTRRIGVITLPSFYEDFSAKQHGYKDYKSASRDVARLLDDFKQKKVDSVLIDLRNDGGGSLTEAIELTGLFIGKGPVVQQRKANGDVTVERATQNKVTWSGPLAVLVNRGSASASEIFAAAIQDYGRGLIIGAPSFGKGTVQNMFDLDQFVKNEKPQLGELKMTISQFFRINGGTTQLRGVTPDILFPSMADAENFGESSFDNALPWMQIKAADYSPTGDLTSVLPVLTALHQMRMKHDKDFQNLEEDIKLMKTQKEKNLVSLNEAIRRKEMDDRQVRMKSRESNKNSTSRPTTALTTASTLQDDGLQTNERDLATELAVEKEQKKAKDILLLEAVHILSDEMSVLQRDIVSVPGPRKNVD